LKKLKPTFQQYHGAAGDPIIIHATDDFMVIAVHVVITSANGDEIERGEAAPIRSLPDQWRYTTHGEYATVTPSRIITTAIDLAGNVAMGERQTVRNNGEVHSFKLLR
jgi:hypothetical protein